MPAPSASASPFTTGYLHVAAPARPLQLALRQAHGRHLRPPDRGHRRRAFLDEMVGGHPRGPRVAGPRLGRGTRGRRAVRAVLPVGAAGRYRELAEQLVAAGHAYYDYRTPEEVAAERERPRRDRETGSTTRRPRDHAGAGRRVRARGTRARDPLPVPEGRTTYVDLVHGPLEFDHAHIEDFVVLRSDGYRPITCRWWRRPRHADLTRRPGDDHISNTPKQVCCTRPSARRSRSSPTCAHPRARTRSGSASATARRPSPSTPTGYLPEAMMNFLALLGWSPGTDQELFTRDELMGRSRSRASREATRCSTPRSWMVQQPAHHAPAPRGAGQAARALAEGGRPVAGVVRGEGRACCCG